MIWKARDGHKLDSKAEMIFDDALAFVGLTHQIHTKIPTSRMLCDFLVGDVYVEIWGRTDPDYLEQKKRKEELYKQRNIKLVPLNEKDCFKAKKVAQAIEAIMRKMNVEQKSVTSGSTRGEPQRRSLLAYQIAENIAVSEGRTKDVDSEIASAEKEIDELNSEIRKMKDRISSLQKRRLAIISEFLV